MEEAKEKVQTEIQEPINKDLAERSKWSNDLMEQLEDNIEKPKYSCNYTGNYYGYDWRDYDYYPKYNCDKDNLLEEKETKKDDFENEYFQFNDEQYPTKENIYDTL